MIRVTVIRAVDHSPTSYVLIIFFALFEPSRNPEESANNTITITLTDNQ